ncbi:MAG: nuclear transport factor 2 family protein [Chitinophagales bacterium]
MTENERLIEHFYTSFQNKDYKSMQSCYADDATFSDPVFVHLNAEQVRAMWEMFCVNSDGLKVEFSNIKSTGINGSAEWIATYIFSSTGNKVTNRITARFHFENGKIVKHTDSFDFYKWARQALGVTGVLLGWTPLVKNKVRKLGIKTLNEFIKAK